MPMRPPFERLGSLSLTSPRDWPGMPPACLEQRAFYLLRRSGIQVLERPRAAFASDTPWADVLHPGHERRQWELLGKAVGIAPWPTLKGPLTWGAGAKTMGDTARELVATRPGALLTPTEGWDRASIEAVVRRRMAEELRVTDFSWTDEFVRDLGCG